MQLVATCAHSAKILSKTISQDVIKQKGSLITNDKKKVYDRDYNLLHKNRIQEYLRHYYARNKDKMKESSRHAHAQSNDRKEYHRQYQLRNKDKLRDSVDHFKNVGKGGDCFELFRSRNQDKQNYERQYFRDNFNRGDYWRRYRAQNKDKLIEWSRQYYFRTRSPDDYFPRESNDKSWKSPVLIREYFDSVAKDLRVERSDDWYRVSREQIHHLNGMLSQFADLHLRKFFALEIRKPGPCTPYRLS